MRNLLASILALTSMTMMSCSSQYMVEGQTSDSKLEGYTLHFRSFNSANGRSIDSTIVVHGQFVLNGTLDSAMMVDVPLPNDMPLLMVLENGDIRVDIASQMKTVSGSPMNDTLYTFLRHLDMLDDQLSQVAFQLQQTEQFSRTATAMMGFRSHHDPMVGMLRHQFDQLYLQRENALSSFIIRNSNNVLGPGVFRVALTDSAFPLTHECVQYIFDNAGPRFSNDPFVESVAKDCCIKVNTGQVHRVTTNKKGRRKVKML